MRLSRFLFFIVSFLLSCFSLSAQVDQKKYADIYFESGRYAEALQALKAYENTNNDAQLMLKRGLCYLFTNQPDACIRDMVAADKLKSTDSKRYKYIAMAFMSKKEYEDAAKYFKIYLNTLKKESEEWNPVITEIRRCGYSANYKYQPQIAYVENLGSGVNTVYDEFGAVQSPTRPERYYFSSAREGATGGMRDKNGVEDVLRGHYYSDIYHVDLSNGNWSFASSFSNLLNSPDHETLQDFSTDGSVVYFTKSKGKINGTLYSDTFNFEKEAALICPANSLPFKPEKGDKDLCILSDSLIVFASDQSGGFGGYDLYYAKRKNSVWQYPVNFGPIINSTSNEISPFVVRSGSRMYFSSDRPETYGGFDIFIVSFSPDGSTRDVSNIGYPINSQGNDVDIELSYDGVFALFTSDRSEGYGGQDLYIAYFKDQVTEQLESAEYPVFLGVIKSTDSTSISLVEKKNESAIPQRDYIAKPLYFAQDEDLLNSSNLKTLKSLVEIMLIYPEIKVDILSHILSEDKKEFDLYSSIKKAEKIADYLIKAGISGNRILMFGCGANYPLAQQYINGIPSSLAEKSNKRIDIILHHEKSQNINVMYDFPVVAVQYRDTLWDNFYNQNQQLTFRVAFSKVGQMLKNDVLNLSNDVIIEKKAIDNFYTYTIGNYSSYGNAKKMKNYLLTLGFQKSVISPYLKGAPVDKVDMIRLSKDYPELELFINDK